MTARPWRNGRVAGDAVKILFVGGYSRSGSTLLARVLGEAPRLICVGETRYLWSRGLIDNVACGCGQPFRSCSFWTDVGAEAFGGWDNVDPQIMTETDRALNLLRTLPSYALDRVPSATATSIQAYSAQLAALYAAISRVAGARTLIETSKDPTFACLLMRMPSADVRILHLVRDSRAVAYSWTRRRKLVSPIDGQDFMPQFKPASTAVKWVAWNAAFHAVSLSPAPYFKLTYESFVANPHNTLRALSWFAGEQLLLPQTQLRDSEVKLSGHHIFSGNPARSKTGWLPIRLDREWRSQLSPADRAKITAITWPLLRIYGYPTFTSSAD
jgi:hypothetical protein